MGEAKRKAHNLALVGALGAAFPPAGPPQPPRIMGMRLDPIRHVATLADAHGNRTASVIGWKLGALVDNGNGTGRGIEINIQGGAPLDVVAGQLEEIARALRAAATLPPPVLVPQVDPAQALKPS